MDKEENAMQIFSSFGFQYENGKQYCSRGINLWHCGYGWSMTRKAFDRMNGLYEYSILGSGDMNMGMALIGTHESVNANASNGYKDSIKELVKRCKYLRFGYVPGCILHHYHGKKSDRKYNDRWKLLVKYQYDPEKHITKNDQGLLIPSNEFPVELIKEISQYFRERNEDA